MLFRMFPCRFFVVFLAMSCVFGYKRHMKIFGVEKAHKRHGKIVGGEEAPLGKFPYQVSVEINGEGHVCAGSILSDRWILTAGHCILREYVYTVVVGTVTLDRGGVRYPIIKLLPHEKLDLDAGINDIGLLKTKHKIKFSSYVDTIDVVSERVGGGEDVLVCGWGVTDSDPEPETSKLSNELLYIKTKTITNQECKKVAPDTWSAPRDHNICTFIERGKGACYGDSGGALVRENGGKSELIGIVSRSMLGGKCAYGLPDVFTRVSSYIDWIEHKMKHE